jgi:hypothetical protein
MQVETDPEPPTCHFPEIDDAEMKCWQQFFTSSTRLFATLNNSLMDAHGLTLFDVLLLDLLTKSDFGCARMRDLADALVMVIRSPDPGDRRGVLASITAKGRTRLGPALKTYAQGIRTLYINQMSRQQMIALGDSCRRVSTARTQNERVSVTP